jgi:hypothetical protein
MATPRKKYFTFFDEHAAAPASNDALAFVVRLLGHLNTRWARNGLDGEAAAVCVISRPKLAELAGCERHARAARVARESAACFGFTVLEEGVYYRIEAHKFASHQWPRSDSGAIAGPEDAPSASASASRVPRPASRVPSDVGDGLEKTQSEHVSPERKKELLARVAAPWAEDSPSLWEKVARLPWRDVEHAIDQHNADLQDGRRPKPFGLRLNDRLSELGLA